MIIKSTEIASKSDDYLSVFNCANNHKVMRISHNVAYKMNFTKTCLLEFDTDTNTMYIKKSNGNVTISKDGMVGFGKIYNKIYADTWFNLFGINPKNGRYKVEYDTENGEDFIKVNFNNYLGEYGYGNKK